MATATTGGAEEDNNINIYVVLPSCLIAVVVVKKLILSRPLHMIVEVVCLLFYARK
jgi:ATP/ADP translocase